jgi:hypothetical protein
MRKKVSATLELKVKKEFNHLCAVCGRPNPQIHHIDGDHSNNERENLLPLCPNHHLLDAHSPTDPIDPLKLKLFRKYRDPAILLSQFHPLFRRMRFLLELDLEALDLKKAAAHAFELADFIGYLEIGGFYKDQISALIGWNPGPRMYALDQLPEYYNAINREDTAKYADQLSAGADAAVALVVELLRFQSWRRIPPYADT